jgi:DNA adenine methylase
MTRAARPILKWAGGKSRLVSHITARLPKSIETYYEPFVGGAAVFFSLAASGRFRQAILSDRNRDLVEVYRVIQENVESVITLLDEHRSRHSEEEYYRVRELDPGDLGPAGRAARLIYLNKTGYNGLFRVNRSGKFNVPYGRYKNPNICDAENLRAASTALSGVKLRELDFADACVKAKPGDAVYFDPPYDPVSKTASFTSYHSEPFGKEEQERLAELFSDLADRGVVTVLSNSDTRLTRKLYRSWSPKKIAVTRPINSNAAARGEVVELLVTGGRPRRRPKS